MARRTKYDPDTFPLLVEGWAREGLIEKSMYEKLGISHTTFEGYKNKYPEFRAALKRGKAPVDITVENSLLKRAIGYTYDETKTIIMPDGGIRKEITKKEVLPDVTADIFWLKNRKRKEWRDKQEMEHSGGINTKIEIIDPSNDCTKKED